MINNPQDQKRLLPFVHRATLMELPGGGVYEFDVEDPEFIFINKYNLNIFGSINKFYASSVYDITDRIIHPDDLQRSKDGIAFLVHNPYNLFIHFRRILYHTNEYHWMLTITGVMTFNDTGTAKQFRGIAIPIEFDGKKDFLTSVESIAETGIEITLKHLEVMFGKEAVEMIQNYFESSAPRISYEVYQSFKNQINCPTDWGYKTLFNFVAALTTELKKFVDIEQELKLS